MKYTCESLDDKYNAESITDFCKTSSEIKVMCPVLCDNCVSASPSSTSSTPSTNPTASSTACVDKETSGKRITYIRAKIVIGDPIDVSFPADNTKKNRKFKSFVKEDTETINNACTSQQVNIGDYCKVTCNNCADISVAPSIYIDPIP